MEFLRTFAKDNKALAVIVLAEKKNIAYPRVLIVHVIIYFLIVHVDA